MKTKRIKRVFNNAGEVLHRWANQSQDRAEYAGRHKEYGHRVRRVYFEGRSVWSYGSHYELGRIIEYRGVKLAIINAEKYSVTTAGYQREAFNAVDGLMPVLSAETFDVRAALLENQDALVNRLVDHFSRRSFWSDHRWDDGKDYGLAHDVRKFNETARALKHPELCLEVTQDYIDLFNAHVKRARAREEELKGPEYEAKREAARLKRAEAAVRKQAREIENWENGATYNSAVIQNLSPQRIRVIGNTVQTSRNATVKLSEALLMLRLIERGVALPGETKVGDFTYQGPQGDGLIRIGCHTFDLNQAKQVLQSKQFKLVQGGENASSQGGK